MNRISVIIKKNGVNLLFVVFMGLMMGCVDVERVQYATDSIPPGQVSNVDVENVPGGAILTYHLPDDDDLLYVKVVYHMSDGTPAEQKGSGYTSKLVVEGLGLSAKQTVHLICGDRSGNESAPVPVEIEPLDAPIYEMLKTMQITEDFGGVRIVWDNPLKELAVLTLYVLNEKGRFDEIQNVYTSSSGRFFIRDYPPEETTFAVTVRDRWNNKTDMFIDTYIPLFDSQLDRTKFRRWNPPGIPYLELPGSAWSIERWWDGLLVAPGYSTPAGITFPVSITFNLGQLARLSRIKLFQRTGDDSVIGPLLFNWGNIKEFSLWASPHPDVTDDFSGWLFMGEFESVKPSGLPLGQLTEEDIAYAEAGEDFSIEDNSDVYVQYVRINVKSVHGVNQLVQGWEIELFGMAQDEEIEE